MTRSQPWTTDDERNWLNTIGLIHEQTQGMSRSALLRHYVEAAEKRRNWDGINREQVLKHAYRLLLGAALEAERGSA